MSRDLIPVVDIFAGPGGLGEGLTRYRTAAGNPRFRLALSIEKDRVAHQTLRLRAFARCFDNRELPERYRKLVQGLGSWSDLAAAHPLEAAEAEREAVCLTLAPDFATVSAARDLIKSRLESRGDWILVGGPPCQAYSLVGRSRNRGNASYVPEDDHRQTLYIEYLQILADHSPAMFVMENVKGILSAKLHSQQLFGRITSDLSAPHKALKREGRSSKGDRSTYSLHSLSMPGESAGLDSGSFILKSEKYGVPQRRHRVVIVGIRNDLRTTLHPLEYARRESKVGTVLAKLPRIRSGLSSRDDSFSTWAGVVGGFRKQQWFKALEPDVRDRAKEAVERAGEVELTRGGEFISRRGSRPVLNHSSRGHIPGDLARYMFASSFALARGTAPTLIDFPTSLLPAHANVDRALRTGHFADRFRVQLSGEPATTVTSHISKDGHYFIHPDPSQCRSLTVREAATLQTFPDDYFFCGPRTAQFVQVGNAVPPALAELIAERIDRAFTSCR